MKNDTFSKKVFLKGILSITTVSLLFFTTQKPVSAEDDPSANLVTAVESVAEKVGPAVVAIKVEKTTRYVTYPNYFGAPYHEDLFNQFFQDFLGQQPQYEYKQAGLGSGVIIDANGFILTNEHVVRGADTITVNLPDGRSFSGTVKGTDSRSDLAVVKIEAPNLPVAALGNSDSIKIGQWVVAIGNPFGQILASPEPTVTTGVISALHRSLMQTSRRDSDYSDLIQTDAAINPGNSGGPLVNLKGEVVGINVAIFSTSGGYQGIGFAIPVNYAKIIVDQLIKGQKFSYGWLGVSIQDIDARLAMYFDLPSTDGVVVQKVWPGSPAEKAGLQDGDIILSVNGVKVHNSVALIRYIGTSEIGKPATLAILHDKKPKNVSVVVGKRPVMDGEEGTRSGEDRQPPPSLGEWRGIRVSNISEDMRTRLNLANTSGVVIIDIAKDSPALQSGLRKGDVIIAVNKNVVRDVVSFKEASEGAGGGSCLVRTVRGFFVLEGK